MQDTAANTRSNMILPDDKWIVQGFRNVIVDPNCSVRSGNHTYSPQEESLKNVKHIAFWKGIVFFITFDQPDTVKWQDAEIELDPVASSSKSRKLPYPGEITGICVSQRALYIFIRINDSTKLIRLNLSSLIGIEPNQDMTPYQVSGINTEDNDMWAFFAVTLQECDSLIIFDKSTGLLEYGIWRSDYRTIKMHKLPQIKNRFYQNSGALCNIFEDKNDDNESI
jgi:hypothetical protein